VAIRLGITNADVEKWKSAGTLFENLNTKMAAFSEAGKESMKNWTTLLSNMNEANQILMGEAFKSPMANIQAALSKVMETIVNINSAQISDEIQPVLTMLKDLGDLLGDFAVATIKAITAAIMGMGEWWAANRDALTGVVASFKVFMGDALSFIGGVAVAFIKFLADSFLWFTKLPEVVKATSIAVGAFTVALYAMNSAMAASAASGAMKMVEALKYLALAVRVAAIDLAGLRIAISALGGPVAWIIAGVAAVSAGVYYMVTATERADAAALSYKKQLLEKNSALFALLPTLRAVTVEMQRKATSDEDAKDKTKAYNSAVAELIKKYPEQESFIKAQIRDGKTLVDVWVDMAKAKYAALQADIAAMKLADQKAADMRNNSTLGGGTKGAPVGAGFKTFKDGKMVGLGGQMSGEVAPEALSARSQMLMIMEKQAEVMRNELFDLADESTLTANAA
jgi:hypothetical protein